MRWEWDDEKNRTNKRDHGLSFDAAQYVFNDPLAVSRPDPHPYEERPSDYWTNRGNDNICCAYMGKARPDNC